MKKLLFVFIILFSYCWVGAQSLTRDERKSAIKYLKGTSKELYKSLRGLSSSQLNFHVADAWSPQECLYHIAFSEGAIRGALDGAMNSPADPAAKAQLNMTDAAVKGLITNRTNKVKTAPPLEPQNTGYTSYKDALNAYKTKRAQLIDLVRTSQLDLRNHLATFPFGKIDAYQVILFIAGHTSRHTAQINEVKMASNYPKT